MKQRPASMFLLLVLFGGMFAGLPISFSESNCCPGAMMNMECCKAMLLQQGRAKFTREEELLCALNCAESGTTLPASGLRVTPPAQIVQSAHPALAQPPFVPGSISAVTRHTHSPPGSPPTYLRNLALLI